MNQPLVTIMMPTYRRPAYLRGALQAALGQTYNNLQIVVRDNGSGDETPQVVREFDDARIEFHQSAFTTSPSENGEECLKLARGEYCTTLADDDLISPNYVEVLVRALHEGDNVAVAYPQGAFIDEAGQITGEKKPGGSYAMDTMDFLMAWCHVELPLATPACMTLRTAWLREIAPELGNNYFPEGHHSDTAFMIWVALRGKIFFTDQATYFYRMHGGNTCMRLTSDQTLTGDRALLSFVARQRAGKAANRLTLQEWDTFVKEAREQLSKTYYWRVAQREAKERNLRRIWSDLVLKPSQVYGWPYVARGFSHIQNELKTWLGGRLSTHGE